MKGGFHLPKFSVKTFDACDKAVEVCISEEARALGWSLAYTRRDVVEQTMSSCNSAVQGLLQRQVGLLTGPWFLWQHQYSASETRIDLPMKRRCLYSETSCNTKLLENKRIKSNFTHPEKKVS